MESWHVPNPTRLPGRGRPLGLFDTSTGRVEVTRPGRTARMYVCGITPYDATHLGHAATYVAFDLVHRYWLDLGHGVEYAQNVTDIDDPLLERAAATGRDWRLLADEQTDLYRSDMTALNVLPPTALRGVEESLGAIATWIDRLRTAGWTYPLESDLYAMVTKADGFGEVAGLSHEEMFQLFAERGGDPDRPGKQNPLDALLWLGPRSGEPSWPSPSGPGRPGWHIGCTAIALDHLGSGFDLQGGGSDLAFPHHEMCAALGRAATGDEHFAQHYVHAGMVAYQGEKMSKSLGNLVFVSTLLESGIEAAVIRLGLLAHHYRSDWEWTDDVLIAAERRLSTWRAALAHGAGPSGADLTTRVRDRLADDLDCPGALSLIDEWAARVLDGESADPDAAASVAPMLDALLGIVLR